VDGASNDAELGCDLGHGVQVEPSVIELVAHLPGELRMSWSQPGLEATRAAAGLGIG
jgi:hypothetical protein